MSVATRAEIVDFATKAADAAVKRLDDGWPNDSLVIRLERSVRFLLRELQAVEPPAHTTTVAPVARIYVVGDKIHFSELYPPGLPDGMHDLFFRCDRHQAAATQECVCLGDPKCQLCRGTGVIR